jgi:hypothetical protein
MFNIVQGRLADQRSKNDWGKSALITAKNAELRSLIVTNKSASTVWIQVFDSDTGTNPETVDANPEEYPLPTNSVLTVTDLRFTTGIFVRAVTAAAGSTLIGANDVKIRCDYQTGPVS